MGNGCEEVARRAGFEVIGALPDQISVSDGLAIRKIMPEDAEALFRLVQDNPDIPQYTAWAKGIDSVEEVVPSLQARSNTSMDGRYVIAVGNQVVGSIWASPGRREAEFGVGYCLDSGARGNGYVSQAITALLEQLKFLGAKHIYFQIVPDNIDSIAVPKRLGFHPAEEVMGVDFPVTQQRWRIDFD